MRKSALALEIDYGAVPANEGRGRWEGPGLHAFDQVFYPTHAELDGPFGLGARERGHLIRPCSMSEWISNMSEEDL